MYFLAFDFGILLTLNLIFYIILGFAVLAGFLKGLKKSLYTFITMAIFYIIFFATINVAVNLLWNANLSFLGELFKDIDPSLVNFTSFADSYEAILQGMIGDEVVLSELSPEALELATGVLIFALKIVWTILYFTVILVIYKILTFIIRMIFFRTKKGENKMRGFGAIVGAANGLMAIFITLIVMGGMISFIDSVSTLLAEVDFSEEDNVEDLSFDPRSTLYQANYSVMTDPGDNPLPMDFDMEDGIAIMRQMVDEYNSNLFVMLANAIQVKSTVNEEVKVPLHINLFDTVLSFKYNENTIAFRYELMIASEVAGIFLDSEFYESNEVTDLKGDEIREVFATIAKSKLVVSALPIAIEYASLQYEQELPFEVEKLYDGSIDFESELAKIGRIAGALFDILNGAGFIEGEGDLTEVEVTGEDVREIFADIAGSDVILLITEALLFPMIQNSEGQIALILTIPEDLDLAAEFLAIGEIFAAIIEADVNFEDLMGDDIQVTLAAISNVDLTILLESQLITEALINILSGRAEVEGLDMFEIPENIVWRDTETEEGELRKILKAFNALIAVAETLDLENFSFNDVADMDTEKLAIFFDSYVIRATLTTVFQETDMEDMPLVFPDVIYDSLGYFTKAELLAAINSIKLIINPDSEEMFDPALILSLSDSDIDVLFESNILYATIGNFFNTVDLSTFIVPDSVNTTILVNGVPQPVVTVEELKNVFKALNVMEITEFSGLGFDASFINKLENDLETDIDQTKVNTLLGSEIIHATLSDIIIKLDVSEGGSLIVPAYDVNSAAVITVASDLSYVTKTEIYNMFRALYFLEITDVNNVSINNTSTIKSNFTVLMNSAILHATVSDKIINIGSTVIVPVKDITNADVLIQVYTVTYVTTEELEAFIDGLDLLGVSDPNSFSQFSFSNLDTDQKRTELLSSAILHATISDQLLSLGSSLLYVPMQDETGNPLIVSRGTPNVDYVQKNEINAIIKAMIAMGYGDVDDLYQEINAQAFIDNRELVLESASMQATVSNKILSSSFTSLVVSDLDQFGNDLRIVFADVTYIRSDELEKLFVSLDEFSDPDLDFETFFVGPQELDTINKTVFFDSYIMQTTVSDYILDQSGDEFTAYGSMMLLVPQNKRIAITVAGLGSETIEKQELLYILDSFSLLGILNYGDGMNADIITNLSSAQIDQLLLSDSIHISIDNMLRSNASVASKIPYLAEDDTTYAITVAIKQAVKNFILATQQLGGISFVNVSFNVSTVTSLDATQRDIVLNSMIVRNILTEELETMMLADPDPYWPDNSDYMLDDPTTFLTKDGINNVFIHYNYI